MILIINKMRQRKTKQAELIKNEMKNFSNFFDAQTLHKEIIKKYKPDIIVVENWVRK